MNAMTIGGGSFNARAARSLSAAAIALAAGSAASAQVFIPIPPLDGGQLTSVSSFSADGASVLGSSRLTPGDSGIALRFGLNGGGSQPVGPNTNVAIAGTANDALIVGNGPIGPFRVQGGGPLSLSVGSFASIAGMSSNGEVIVGNNLTDGAFIFNNAGLTFSGSPSSLGKLGPSTPGGSDGADGPNDLMLVVGLSADGSIILGSANRFVPGTETVPDVVEFIAAYRTQAGPWQRIFSSSGPGSVVESSVEGVSSDGSMIAGWARANANDPFSAFVTFDSTVFWLPSLAPGFAAFASAVEAVPAGPVLSSMPYVGGSVDSPNGPRAVVWVPQEVSGTVTYSITDLNTNLPPEYAGWVLTGVRDFYLPAGESVPIIAGSGLDPDGKERGWVFSLNSSIGCPADFNNDGALNLDDVSDYISDYYNQPPIPGGLQPEAPTYNDVVGVGFGVPCANAPDAPAPYAADAYRVFGYRVAFSADGSIACPASPEANFPTLDNLGEFISLYYSAFGTPACP
jgi:hypothetical protein